MQVEEGRNGPALCAPSLSKTSHPQAYYVPLVVGGFHLFASTKDKDKQRTQMLYTIMSAIFE